MWLREFFEEDARHIGGGEGAEAVDLHEDSQLMLELQHVTFNSCKRSVGDSYLVAPEECRHIALAGDDAVHLGVDDGAETVELTVGDYKIWVAAILGLPCVVIIWCKTGDGELYQFAELLMSAMYEQQTVVEWLLDDHHLWLVLIGLVDLSDGYQREVELARLEQRIAADDLKESVVHLLRTAVSRANGEP